MIGAIAGDIIGSPYMFENFEDPNMFIRLRPFEENRFARFVDGRNSAISVDELNRLTRKEQRKYTFSEDEVREAGPTHFTHECPDVASALMHINEEIHLPDTLSETLTIGVLCGEWASTADEAVRLAQSFVGCNQLESHALQGAVVTAHAVWMASHGQKAEEIKGVMESVYGLRFMDLDSHSLVMKGQFVINKNGKMDIGDGIKCGELAVILPAALDCVLASRSFDEAVQRAVAIGGRSNLVGAMAGALSEHVFGVPSDIRRKAMQYLDSEMCDLVEVFEHKSKNREESKGKEVSESSELSVIRMGQKSPIYVIPENRLDMEEAARRVCKNNKTEFNMIRLSELQETLQRLSVQRDLDGNELSGTFIDSVMPECYHLWLQDGQLKSSSTRKAIGEETLPSANVRNARVSEFEALKVYADDVRTELERLAGYTGHGHIHFAEAFYPRVYNRTIDLMQGDVLRGRVRIDDHGNIRVDTNISTGSNRGEYLEGVLNSMDIFHKNDGVAEIKQKLNEFCLDYGKIEDEDERIALRSDDQEAASVKMKYMSNVDRAVLDMSRTDELRMAVAPELTPRERKSLEHKEKVKEESAGRYEGKTRREALDSTRYQGSVFTVGHSNYTAEEFLSMLKQFGIDVLVDVRSFPKSSFNSQFNAEELQKTLEDAGISYRYSGKEMGGHILRNDKDCHELWKVDLSEDSSVHVLVKDEHELVDVVKAMKKERGISYGVDCARLEGDEILQFRNSKDCTKEFAVEIDVKTGKNLTYSEVISRDSFKEELKVVRDMTREGHRVAVMCTEYKPEECHRFAMIGYALAHPTDGRIKPLDVQHITRQRTLVPQSFLENKTVKAYGLSEDPEGLKKALDMKCISLLSKKADDRRIKIKKPMDKTNRLKH